MRYKKTYVPENRVVNMPSKREPLGKNATSDGPNWSEFRWNRISAFIGGVGITVLYLWVNLFRYLLLC